MKNNVKYYQVAGITVQVSSDFLITENTFHPKFNLFEVDGPGGDNVMIHHYFLLPEYLKNPKIYKNPIYETDSWKVIKTKDAWIYKYNPTLEEESGYPVVGLFNDNHTAIKIYLPDISERQYKEANFNALSLFNSDQILFSKLLCCREGLILHSNGFDINGNGVLLTGESGAGKSTLSKMLKNKGFQILCDDRMFIKKNETFFAYGNWCHGTVPDFSSTQAPLKGILFLEKSKTNMIQKITSKNEIFQKLITSVVRPFLNREEWDSTLKILEEIVDSTSCYKIKFDLSGEICELLDNLFDFKGKHLNGC